MTKKLALVIGYGQSNELGTGVAARLAGTAILNSDSANNVRHSSVFGLPRQSLTTTAPYVQPASMFDLLKESIALQTGWAVQLFNFARGGTACTDNWCGWDSGNNRAKTVGESGYDPTGLIAATVAGVSDAVSAGYEVWTITQGHQQDLTLGRTADQVVAASAHIQNRLVAAGASKVFIGKTPRFIGGATEAEWNAGGKIHLIADGVVAAVPGAIVGADLTEATDLALKATDNLQYVHLNHAGGCWAARKWFKAMQAANVF